MAFVEARQKQHEFITVEHLLLAMLDNPSAAEVLKACGVDLDELRGVLSDFIQEHTPQAFRTSAADGLSSIASSRCSTVMNSCCFCLASTKAMWRETSSSCAIIDLPSRHSCQAGKAPALN
jgi:ATP-dependent Clp protease ATP-binding subunit ClpA